MYLVISIFNNLYKKWKNKYFQQKLILFYDNFKNYYNLITI